jgi:proteasome lid subunit RPN8/RPN11
MNKQQYQALRELQNANVKATKENTIKFNAGGSSETIKHIVGKTLVARIALVNGYQIDTEVAVPHGEIDVLIHSHPNRLSYAVELETGLTEETKQDKTQRYVHSVGPIDDIIPIEVNDIPVDMIEAAEHIADKMGLEL